MSDKNDRKLVEVPVARFGYRHEAEFAAGFLDDAGIPYRLQIDDPALGMPMSSSATIWVAAIDEPRARDVLEVDGESRGSISSPTGRPVARLKPSRTRSAGVILYGNIKSDLGLRQRVVAFGGGGAILGVLQIDSVREAHPAVPIVVALVAAVLVVVGLVGRAPTPLARLLSALSGDAP